MPSLPLLPSLRAEFPHLRPTPTAPVASSTARALDLIHRTPLPHPPFQTHPDLEAEASEACPASIRVLWALPEAVLEGGGVCAAGSWALGEVVGGEREGMRRGSVCTDASLATAFGIEHVVGERRRRRGSVSSSSSPAEVHQRIDTRARDLHSIAARLLAQPSGDDARPAAAPARSTSPSPPAAPPCLEAPSPFPGDRRSRREGRASLGLALVSVRDRVDDETWRDGIEQMRQSGGDVGALYEILSLGLQARTGVRDV